MELTIGKKNCKVCIFRLGAIITRITVMSLLFSDICLYIMLKLTQTVLHQIRGWCICIFIVGQQLPDDSYMPSTNDVSPVSFENKQNKMDHCKRVCASVCVCVFRLRVRTTWSTLMLSSPLTLARCGALSPLNTPASNTDNPLSKTAVYVYFLSLWPPVVFLACRVLILCYAPHQKL